MKTQDPRPAYQRPAYSDQVQSPPGSEQEMSPRVDHGESSCQGADRLKAAGAWLLEQIVESDEQ
jgi:hypothetical protein